MLYTLAKRPARDLLYVLDLEEGLGSLPLQISEGLFLPTAWMPAITLTDV
jgi:hypothetical protein